MAGEQPRIFISYSTHDGAERAAELRRELEAKGFAVWQDLVALQGSADWWTQIEAVLRSKALQHFILIVTPKALASRHVRAEIRLARQEGKTVSPVRGPDIESLDDMPRWLGNVYDLNVPERRTTLIRVLELPSSAARVPMMAPEPPEDFVLRPREFDALKQQLLDAKDDAVAITAALRGAGGYGKTTLAQALAHDPDIQDAYFDGVLWVELGEQGGGRVLAEIADLVKLLTGEAREMSTNDGARTALAEALGDRRILLVVDDVWQRPHLEPFLFGGRNTTRLVTTRFDPVLPDKAARQPVDAMQDAEALALLGRNLPPDQVAGQTIALSRMATRLGEWAQLLKLANGFLRDCVDFGATLEIAIADLSAGLDEHGLVALDAAEDVSYEDRRTSIAKVIDTSLGLLNDQERARFGELGIFPEDVDIPTGIAARLWAETGPLNAFQTRKLLIRLSGLSLLFSLDLGRQTLRLHDTTRHFLRYRAGEEGLAAQNQALVRAIGGINGAKGMPTAEAEYVYRHLPQHLADAHDRQALDALLLDPGWLKAKLAASGSPQSIVGDYTQHRHGRLQDLIGRTLGVTIGICARDPRQLLPQILARLMAVTDADTEGYREAARRLVDRPALLTERASLRPPGAEIARLEGHTDWVTALAVLPDGRLASGSSDTTVRLWDPATGAETTCLEGHTDWVTALAVLPDGHLASGSNDGTVRLWNPATGAEIARLEGHAGAVRALAVLQDGRLASGSFDTTVRLWDPATGAETARLKGHTRRMRALAVLQDGRLASGADDKTVRLWDPATGAEIARLGGHTSRVRALAVLQDGSLASGSDDRTVRLWDPATGAETTRLEGHIGAVTALAVLPDGRLASGSSDTTTRLWDPATGTGTARLESHTGAITALAVLPDGRLASGSSDTTARLWDPVTGTGTAHLEGHTDEVTALRVLPDGRLASGSNDTTVRLWDPATGAETARLEGHADWVRALAVLADGRLASGSDDWTMRLWDPTTGAETARLEGHTGWFTALAVLPDGRLASGGNDGTVRLWDPATGAKTARLRGHTGWFTTLAVLPDGRLASGGNDGTVRLWDSATGAQATRLEGHTGAVTALAVLADGRLASGSADNTVRLWNPATGAETARLEGHADWVRALAVLADGRLVSGSDDNTVRLWDPATGIELCRLELDRPIHCLAVPPPYTRYVCRVVAGDEDGRLHWLEILD